MRLLPSTIFAITGAGFFTPVSANTAAGRRYSFTRDASRCLRRQIARRLNDPRHQMYEASCEPSWPVPSYDHGKGAPRLLAAASPRPMPYRSRTKPAPKAACSGMPFVAHLCSFKIARCSATDRNAVAPSFLWKLCTIGTARMVIIRFVKCLQFPTRQSVQIASIRLQSQMY